MTRSIPTGFTGSRLFMSESVTEGHPDVRRSGTSRFLCTTDDDGNQIASFYPGAMAEARHIELAPIVDAVGGVDLVLIPANDPEAMFRYTAERRRRGYPFAADPLQQAALLSGKEIDDLSGGARLLLVNEYESGLMTTKTGRTEPSLCQDIDGPQEYEIDTADLARRCTSTYSPAAAGDLAAVIAGKAVAGKAVIAGRGAEHAVVS